MKKQIEEDCHKQIVIELPSIYISDTANFQEEDHPLENWPNLHLNVMHYNPQSTVIEAKVIKI